LSFIVSFLFFFVVFFINQLLLMAEDILERQAPVFEVIKLVIFATPAIIAMSFPFGSLVGALMAVGRLSSENELLVMGASGIPRTVIIAPLLVLGLFFSLVSFYTNDYLLPLGTINYGKLYRKLITASPALELKPYSIKKYRDTTIVTGAMKAGSIYDVVIIDSPKDGASRIINASSAELLDSGDATGVISLVLKEVFIQENNPGIYDRFEYSTANRMEYNIPLTAFSELGAGLSPREMSSVDVAATIQKKEESFNARIDSRLYELEEKRSLLVRDYLKRTKDGHGLDNSISVLLPQVKAHFNLAARPLKDRSLDIYRLEYYKKFSIPAGALFFVFLAFPLGERARKSGRALGFGIGLLVAVVYWGMLIGGQTLGLRVGFDPFLAMWAPNLVVVVTALPLLVFKKSA
jgi:lipopolysaccharide export system permease protein